MQSELFQSRSRKVVLAYCKVKSKVAWQSGSVFVVLVKCIPTR